jgi:DNA-binding PadR family transcriptional regulator
MTKREILDEFSKSNIAISPDELRFRLKLRLDRRSLYSYLLRLNRQGLLARAEEGRGRLRYSLTARGQARLEYFKRKA